MGRVKQSPPNESPVNPKLGTLTLLWILISLILFGVFSRILYNQETAAITASFQRTIDQKAAVIEREMQLNLELLFALKSGVALLADVNETSFHALVGDVLERSPVIHAFAWAPWVTGPDKAAFEQAEQAERPGFRLLEQNSAGSKVGVGLRPWYVPVKFIAPHGDNQVALGFDLASEERRRQALLKARASGEMVATAGLTLVQETAEQTGILVFAPLYRGQPETAEERQESHYAYLNGVFRIGELFNRSVDRRAGDMILRIIDQTDDTPTVLYASTEPSETPWRQDLVYRRDLAENAGRRWAIEAIPATAFVAGQRSFLPILVMLAGALLVALLATYVSLTARRNVDLKAAKETLEKVSRTDDLTGLANRRHFDQHLQQEWERAKRDGLSVSLVMLDIDYFKPFNDEYGHPAGDHCLKQVAHAIGRVSHRPTDLVARYGGEEFVIILPQTEDPEVIAETCRATIEWLKIPHRGSPKAVVTISAGVCSLTPRAGMHSDVLIKKADDALYSAKRKGRNRVELAPAECGSKASEPAASPQSS